LRGGGVQRASLVLHSIAIKRPHHEGDGSIIARAVRLRRRRGDVVANRSLDQGRLHEDVRYRFGVSVGAAESWWWWDWEAGPVWGDGRVSRDLVGRERGWTLRSASVTSRGGGDLLYCEEDEESERRW
jgi:hypothetical protein